VTARAALRDLRACASPERAAALQRYFRTGPGEYGEGDRFLGLTVPMVRRVAREHASLDLDDCRVLLASRDHEARLLALLVLVRGYERGDDARRSTIYRFYLDHTDRIDNWDLVDLSAPSIVGRHLEKRSRAPLRRLARSKSLWERRIAIVATFHHTKAGDVAPALHVAERLLGDRHDLIHKAVGWMLREVGKRDRAVLEAFLRPRYHEMPRTMLRYAIEKFPEAERRRYMQRTPNP
jgi:3-methyladenine DNA glycosylase AlkD